MKFRRATLADADAIQSFIKGSYGNGAPYKGPARWLWQFVNCPFRPAGDEGPAVWIADDAGKVAGQTAVQDATLWLDGQPLEAGWIVDVMVDPAYRGQGLGHRIHDAILPDRAILITLTMALATRKIAERAGCITLGPTGQYARHHRLRAATVGRYLDFKAHERPDRARLLGLFRASLIGPALVAAAARTVAAVRGFGRPKAPLAGFRVEEVARFPDLVDTLWNAARPGYPAIFERSARFLNWRFCDVPDLVYRRFLLFDGAGTLRGTLVTRVTTGIELPAGVVVDAFARADDDAAHDALLALAERELAPHSDYLEAAGSSPAMVAALARAGYVRMRVMRPTVVVRDPALKARMAAMPDAWHFTKADHDWDQVHPA
ncbi:MAG: GNAT family N-acetyltransferase [Sandarakinorhabdus sp.]|nr:GNAT family N-acetyltransferase [Sandarakinorhabdus sp.]